MRRFYGSRRKKKGGGGRRKRRISRLHNFSHHEVNYADQIKDGNIDCARNVQGELRHARNYMRETEMEGLLWKYRNWQEVKGKENFNLKTGREGPDVEKECCTLTLTSALDGMCGRHHTSAALSPLFKSGGMWSYGVINVISVVVVHPLQTEKCVPSNTTNFIRLVNTWYMFRYLLTILRRLYTWYLKLKIKCKRNQTNSICMHCILSFKYKYLVLEDGQHLPKRVAFVDQTNKICRGWRNAFVSF